MTTDLIQQYEEMLKFEHEFKANGYFYIAGADEAGRGPVAGPIFAAAVVMNPEEKILGVNDSKQLSAVKREKLFEEICAKALDYAIFSLSAEEIDRIGIAKANSLVLYQAIMNLRKQPDFVLVDFFKVKELTIPYLAIPKGDTLSVSIAAASILAKVARDRYMIEQDRIFPEYGFAKHKGYGTKNHRLAIQKFGLTSEHRRSFLQKWTEIII